MREVLVRILVPECVCRLCVWLLLLYRRLCYGYPFRRIPLTQGKYAIVDPDDYERLNRHKWYAVNMRRTFYAQRGINIGDKRVPVMMHREILKVADGLLVDHINHNGLDNRKANLRPATRAENGRNRRKWSKRKCYSRFKGVCWHKYRKRWTVQIWFNGKMKYIGYFDSEIEAGKAYDRAARKYHKDFAVLNFS